MDERSRGEFANEFLPVVESGSIAAQRKSPSVPLFQRGISDFSSWPLFGKEGSGEIFLDSRSHFESCGTAYEAETLHRAISDFCICCRARIRGRRSQEIENCL